MRKGRGRQALLGLAAASCLLLGGPAGYGQASDDALLGRSVGPVLVEAQTVSSALSYLAYEHDIPIGIEVASRDKSREIKIELQSATVREALDAVVAYDPRYEWRVEGGVINFAPKSDRDDFVRDVLETTLRHFAIKEKTSLFTLKENILALPEVKAKLDQARVTPNASTFFGLGEMYEVGKGFTLQMSNATLREALNRIIRTSETRFWVLNKSGEDEQSLVLNF